MVVDQFQICYDDLFLNCSITSLKNLSRTVPENRSRTNNLNISDIVLKPQVSIS